MRIAVNLLLLPLLLQLSACASGPALPYPDKQDRQQVLTAIQDVRTQALQNDKLALYVLGANWCHDSVDFASMLKRPETALVLESEYVVQFINVGYLENIREYVNLFDVPVIYGTPTVMIVDSGTGTLLNRDALSEWRNASNRKPDEARDYLAHYATQQAAPAAAGRSPALDRALRSIDEFEQRQAERIYAAYKILSPLLAAKDKGKPAPGFDVKWSNLAAMRSAITNDLADLRRSAHEQDAAGATAIELSFPDYLLFND